MNKYSVAVAGALLLASFAGLAEETRLAVADLKQEMRMPERAEAKPIKVQKKVQKKLSRPAKRDASLDWPQLG